MGLIIFQQKMAHKPQSTWENISSLPKVILTNLNRNLGE